MSSEPGAEGEPGVSAGSAAGAEGEPGVSAGSAAGAGSDNDRLAAMEACLATHKSKVKWYFILNNHTSTRPKEYGGALFTSLGAVIKQRHGPDHPRSVTIDLPCSYSMGDGQAVTVTVTAEADESFDILKEAACLRTFARLLLGKPSFLIYRGAHWTCSSETLLSELDSTAAPGISAGAAVVTSRSSAYELPDDQEARDVLLKEVLKEILEKEGGKACLSRLITPLMGKGGGLTLCLPA